MKGKASPGSDPRAPRSSRAEEREVSKMAEIRIRTLKDGPYEVRGTVELVDAKKAAFQLSEDPIYLCRCGQSANKPFCDGSHQKVGFKSEEPAR
jgi:CDGSH-type Zn-finger protein